MSLRQGGWGCTSQVRFREVVVGLLLFLMVLSLSSGVQNVYASEEDNRYDEAIQSWRNMKWDQAISQFESIIASYPKSKRRNDAELYLGHSYLSRGNFQNVADGVKGREHLYYIIQQGKNALDYRDACLHYGYSFYCLKNFAEAKSRFETYVQEFPTVDSLQYVYYYLGDSEIHLGNYQKAEEWLNTCLTKYPSGALKDQCLLDKAVCVGKQGRYQEADQQLSTMALNPDFKFKQDAQLQRAGLKIDQQQYAEALRILDSLIAMCSNMPDSRKHLVSAYQYQVHCYIEMNNYDAALKVANELEKLEGLTPDIALLKIKVLTKLERFAEANALLDQLRNAQFNLYAPDVVSYYDATVRLAQGKWGEVIDLLTPLLKVTANSQNPSNIRFAYYDTTTPNMNKLSPKDFVDACGTLVLAYASRYSATRQYPNDDAMQKAIFDATFRYASSQSNPLLLNRVNRIDTERTLALTKPIQPSSQGGTGLVVNPNVPMGGGAGYPGNVPSGGVQPGGYTPIQPGGFTPGQPRQPDQQGYAGGQAGGFVPGQPSQPGQPGYAGGQAGGLVPSQPGRVEAMDEADASTILTQAQSLFVNNDLDRANEKLLGLLTSSPTFWQDCPTVAPSAALLRTKVLFKLKKFPEAQTQCSMLVKQAPNTQEAAEANYYLGYCYDFYAQQDQAIDCFRKVVTSKYETDFTDDANYYLGMNEWERKNPVVAEESFKKVYRSYKNSDYWGHSVWALAQIEFEAHNYEEAERLVNEALGDKPDQAIADRLLFLKGEIALKLRDYEKAKTAFDMLITQYPTSAKVTVARNRLATLPDKGETDKL